MAASAWRWRSSEASRSAETPSIAIRRSGPTGTALTTASHSKRSPVAVSTAQPAARSGSRSPGSRSGSGRRAPRPSSAPPWPSPPRPSRSPRRRSRRTPRPPPQPPCAGPRAARCAPPTRPRAPASPARARGRRSASRRPSASRRRPRSGRDARPRGATTGRRGRPRRRAWRTRPRRRRSSPGRRPEPRPVAADHPPLGEQRDLLAGAGAGLGAESGDERQSELVDQPAVGGVEVADQLAAELHQAPVGKPRLLDPPAGAATGLDHDHVGAGCGQVARRAEPGEPGADDDDVSISSATLDQQVLDIWIKTGGRALAAQFPPRQASGETRGG